MQITDEDREWIDARANQLFRESEHLRGGIRPNTVMPQDFRDYFVVQAAWELAADALIEAEKRGAERMRERAADVAGQRSIKLAHQNDLTRGYACGRSDAASAIRALPLTEETPDADT